MEGAGDLDLTGGEALGCEVLDRALDRSRWTREDDLVRRVLVREHDVFYALERGADLVGRAVDRGHGAGVFSGGVEDRVRARLREVEEALAGEGVCVCERDQLTIAVTGEVVSADADAL